MRYSPEQKKTTRRKILDAASRAFREHGVDGASVSEIMAEAGLTVGGFYRHFESKEELFRAALEKAMGETLALMQDRRIRRGDRGTHGQEWKERAAGLYLTPEHRQMQETGCPIPGLSAEVGRRDETTRQSFERSLLEIAREMALRLEPDTSDAEKQARARHEAWGFLSTLVGSLLLSRAVDDDELAEQILAAGREASAR
jgi:TetR/AcrR family transcriptional repressor of nem operon